MPLKMYDLVAEQQLENGDSGDTKYFWSKGLHDSELFANAVKDNFGVEVPSNHVKYSYGKKVPDFKGFMWIEIFGEFKGMKGAFPVTYIEMGD